MQVQEIPHDHLHGHRVPRRPHQTQKSCHAHSYSLLLQKFIMEMSAKGKNVEAGFRTVSDVSFQLSSLREILWTVNARFSQQGHMILIEGYCQWKTHPCLGVQRFYGESATYRQLTTCMADLRLPLVWRSRDTVWSKPST